MADEATGARTSAYKNRGLTPFYRGVAFGILHTRGMLLGSAWFHSGVMLAPLLLCASGCYELSPPASTPSDPKEAHVGVTAAPDPPLTLPRACLSRSR